MTFEGKRFRDSWLLVDRTERDREALKGEIEAFVESTPSSCAIESDPKNFARFHVRPEFAQEPDPRGDWAINVGTMAQHLRSALDYIPASLANPDDPSRSSGTQFPIYTEESRYLERGGNSLTGVPENLRPLFDRQQPYARGDDPETGPLAVLARITNTHKHRVLHALAQVPEGGAVRVTPTGGEPFTFFVEPGDMLDSETDLFSFILPGPVEGEFRVDCSFSMAIGFGNEGFQAGQLNQIIARVREIISVFEAEIV